MLPCTLGIRLHFYTIARINAKFPKINGLFIYPISLYLLETVLFERDFMRSKRSYLILVLLMLTFTAAVSAATVRTTQKVLLGETEIKINVYENEGGNLTFVAPHHNEQTGLKLAKDYVEKYGGRLIEIESFDAKGSPARYLTFTASGKTYTVDPNRIFTAQGRSCAGGLSEVDSLVEAFAANLLKAVFADGKGLPAGERFLVAIHNNTDVDSKTENARTADLTAYAFVKTSLGKELSHGVFQDQADGVYLSNTEDDQDNFVFLSGLKYVGYFAEKGFNVVVQKSAAKLNSQKCSVDDGSLSVFSAQQGISYICLEADAATGGYRQQQMLEAVYQLARVENESVPLAVAKK